VLALLAPSAASAASGGDPSAARKAAQERANAAAGRLASAETALAKIERDLGRLEAEAKATKTELGALESQVKAVAVNQYVRGGVTQPAVFDKDLGRTARTQALVRFVTLGNTDALDRYRAAREDYERDTGAVSKRLKERQAAAASLRRQRQAAFSELDRIAAAEKAFLARQAAEREAAARRAAAARTSSRQSASAAAAARPAAAPRPAATSGATGVIASGEWVCPVQGPRSFSNDWGQPRSGGRRHQGNDILSPRGTPVVASVSGTVRHHNSSLGGLSYYLNGDDGNTYFGTHLQSFAASGRVAAGTVVGYVGDTGNARGTPHLHFEIHPGGGGPVNPYPTLSKYC
jgi:murein DD-endopeptidase MepM/ murein hydrolase activator NlpD